MRYVVALWALPLVVFWGWYLLSFNDIHFGYVFLTRDVHEIVFRLYGEMLGIDPAAIPMLILEACIFDSLLITAFFAFRRRREIRAWIQDYRARKAGEPISAAPEAGPVFPAE